VGVSACLLGEPVRWNGGHERDVAIAVLLAREVELLPVCPEAEAGMGVPRPPIQLAAASPAPRLVEVESGRDWTERVASFVSLRLDALADAGLCGFVLKSRSPSCGVAGVPIFERGAAVGSGAGFFARRLAERFPGIPIRDETQLAEPGQRDEFVAAVRAYGRRRMGITP
jgi:uncharacterized protein YbbK (DUF523 family)